MKNAKHLAMGLVCLPLLFGSCKEASKKEDRHEEPPKLEAPKSIISLEEAKSYYENYTKNRVDIIKNFETTQRVPDQDFMVARFVDFDYKSLKDYIAYIEQEAGNANVDIATFRFYFSNYPNKATFPDGQKIKHPRQNSLFILPTLDKGGENFGFYIGPNGNAELVKDWSKKHSEKQPHEEEQKSQASFIPTLAKPLLYNGGSTAGNRGTSGPPPSGDF